MRTPTRLTTNTIQGKDSYVTFTSITWGERKDNDEAEDAARKAGQAWDFVAARERMIYGHVRDWNWTDGDGKKLALPSECEGFEDFRDRVLREMPNPEIEFLAAAIVSATPEKLKN